MISVIIPTLNEEKTIGVLIDYLQENKGDYPIEIIISDGGSTDSTLEIVKSKNTFAVSSPSSGRAFQLNYGAAMAKGGVFYFVHADTFPPKNFTECIMKAIENGYHAGCCAYKFNSQKWYLKINNFFTLFNSPLVGGGDQTLFVTQKLFRAVGGYNTHYVIMEDFEITSRLKKQSLYKILKHKALVSDRKYSKNSYLSVNIANSMAMLMYKIKVHPQRIALTYKKMLKW